MFIIVLVIVSLHWSGCFTGLSFNVYVVLSPYDLIVLVGFACIPPEVVKKWETAN